MALTEKVTLCAYNNTIIKFIQKPSVDSTYTRTAHHNKSY